MQEKEENIINVTEDKNLKDKIEQSDFVFSYSYGFLSQKITNFIQLIVLDKEVIVKKLFNDKSKNVNKIFDKIEQTSQIKNYFLQQEILEKLEIFRNTTNEDLKIYINSRIDYIYLKVNGIIYKFDGNSANLEYRKFIEEIIKKVYTILNIDYAYSNKINSNTNRSVNEEIINKIDEKIKELKQQTNSSEEEVKEYENLKQEDHLLISSWYGKKEVTIQEKLVSFKKDVEGNIYSLEKKMGYTNETDNVSKITRICKLHPRLVENLKKYIIEKEKNFDKTIENGISLDKGTKISIKLDDKYIIIKDVEEYYVNISNKINEIQEENNKILEDIKKKINPDEE